MISRRITDWISTATSTNGSITAKVFTCSATYTPIPLKDFEFSEARSRRGVSLGQQEIFADLSQRVFFPVQPPRLRESDFPVACRESFATGVVEAFRTSEKKSPRVNGRVSPSAFLAEGLG